MEGKAVVPIANLKQVIAAVHHFAHAGTLETLELFK